MLRPTDGPAAAKLAIEEFVDQHPQIAAGNTSVSSHMLGQTISSEGGIRGIALYALGIIAALREQVVEISLDATFGTNSSGHDLFAVLAELNGTGAPLMYFLLDTKDMRGDGRRIEMLAQVLAMLKGMGIKPRFVGCDKESAEINAIGQVWPDAKVQLCYWHVRRALRQRLGSGKATTTSAYDSVEAAQTVPGLDVCWGITERRRHGLFVCTCQSRRAPTAQNPQALNTTWDTAGRLELAKEDTEDLINFISRHFNLHSLFPTLSGAQLTAEQLRVQAATEAYQHCHAKGWARVWAYLWANWYRREDWERWARSACAESVPVLKTTMICESHWRVVKHDYLHRFARPRIDHVTHIIRTRLVPQLCARVGALLSGNTRMAMPSWRRAFVVEWRKREDTDEVSAETLARYRTCPHLWICACESFLQSRFLFCKHLIKMSEPMSTTALKQMHRHRTPPFWTHAGMIPLLSAEACEHCGDAEARAGEDADENGMNGGADDDGEVDEGYDGEGDSIGGAQGVGDDGPDDDEEVETSVQELFDSAMTTLTRTGELLRRERPWGSRALIEAVLRSNRQNIKLLEEDEHRRARQSQARTWRPGQHPATMYLRGERPV
ncbi:hypothetical protein CF326_g1770 [Tilletia indica]|uniref:MULE transposase domain-containing protein n=1 Tax=Tilletia indica TaxID=43049 RepID=A0A177T799_9BASI|nr:hypothetical protein CF326_g1770 [Tilletia indica]KAE8241950.1 hypothetical protein A4X13_0g7188 [Tilletia indica]